jgi:hypothetical protein
VLANIDDGPSKDELLAEDLEVLRARLDEWMRSTDDPLLDGPIPVPPGARVDTPDQRSASEPQVSPVA